MLDEFRSTNITWDKATSRIYSPVTANASDENGRKLVVQIVNSGQVEDLTGATLHLYWITRDKVHDGLDVFKATDLKKGEFELSYTTGMLSNQGVLNANLVLIDTVGRVVSEQFNITVTEGIDNDAIQSENSFSSLTKALIDISNLEQNYAPRLNDLTAQLQQTEQELSSQLAQKASLVDLEVEKARINNLVALPDGSTTNDARLEDIKIGADGVTYATPGEAIRSQLNDVNTYLEVIKKGSWNVKNEAVNGDFSSSTISHITSTLDLQVVDGKLKASKTNWTYASGATITIQNAYNSWDAGDIYYVRASLRVIGDTNYDLRFGAYSRGIGVNVNNYREPNVVSGVFSPESKNFVIRHFLNSSEYVEITLDNFVTINLTKTFGAGNEPTKEEMDELLGALGGWFGGVAKENLVTLWKFGTDTITDTVTNKKYKYWISLNNGRMVLNTEEVV